jgi:MFS family permease
MLHESIYDNIGSMKHAPWKERNYRFLLGGQFVSYIGTEVSNIALPLIVLTFTGSPAQAGIITALRGFVYLLLAIPASILIDRWNRYAYYL